MDRRGPPGIRLRPGLGLTRPGEGRHRCAHCQDGVEQFCPPAPFTYSSPDEHLGGFTFGGYSERMLGSDVKHRFSIDMSSLKAGSWVQLGWAWSVRGTHSRARATLPECARSSPSAFLAVRFREEQRFRQLWIWLLILPLCVGTIGFFGWAMVEQLVRGRPVGNQPMPDLMLMIMGPLFILLMAGLLWVMWVARLVTEVRDDGIYIRFYPVHRGFRGFLWEDIDSFEARTYRPVLEYGGWGIRFGSGGKAYNVSGNRGLQLALGDGRSERVLIGSQRAEELAMAVEAARGEAGV